MPPTPPQPNAAKVTRAPGEPLVWICGMGLALGMAMILGLLGLIIFNGAGVFWAKPVVRVELRPAEGQAAGEPAIFAGEITRRQIKATPLGGGEPEREWQLFVGNYDAYGFSFKYIDEARIAAVEKPGDLWVVERMENGNAIGYPVALRGLPEGDLPAGTSGFEARFRELEKEVEQRRDRIDRIRKVQIGRINREMEKLRLDERAGRVTAESAAARRSGLETQYAALAAEAESLAKDQLSARFIYRLPAGGEREIPMGAVVSHYAPNRLGWWDKLGLAAHRLRVFLAEDPREANTEGGIFPAIFGTAVMTLLMSIAVVPFGVLSAIYLREYAKQGATVRAVRIAVNNLAGVPSIVFGVFGLGFFVYLTGGSIDSLFYSDRLPTPTFGTPGILWASLTLALMTVPVVIVATEEALAAVPRGAREGSLACGASKWQTIQRVVLPASVSGILTGLILAMARGAGEVAPLMLVGVVKLAPTLPVDSIFPFVHLDRKFMHLGFHIFDLGFQSRDSEAAKPMVFATTLLLIFLVVLLNLTAISLRDRLRRRYALGAF